MNIVGCEFLSSPILRLIFLTISNIFSPDNPTFELQFFQNLYTFLLNFYFFSP